MFRLPYIAMPIVMIAGFIVRGFVTLLIVYVGARLAIRHERHNAG